MFRIPFIWLQSIVSADAARISGESCPGKLANLEKIKTNQIMVRLIRVEGLKIVSKPCNAVLNAFAVLQNVFQPLHITRQHRSSSFPV